jgi:hypothetical protein
MIELSSIGILSAFLAGAVSFLLADLATWLLRAFPALGHLR